MRVDREDNRLLGVQASLLEAFEGLASSYHRDVGLEKDTAISQAANCLEALLLLTRKPPFDDDGYIRPIHVCTEAEFVRWFGWNPHRQGLLQRFRRWTSLARAVGARRLLLDGSFVTAKDEPGDIDAVVLLPEDFRDQLLAGDPNAVELRDMFLTREPKELFAAEDEEDWWGWFEFFSRTREANGRRKGLIEVTL